MADRQYPTPPSGGERQQTPPQADGETRRIPSTYNSERRPAGPYIGGEVRRTSSPQTSGGETRSVPPAYSSDERRTAAPSYRSERRPAGPYIGGERQTSSSSRTGGDLRQASSGGERRPAGSSYSGERRPAGSGYSGERRPAGPYAGGSGRQTSPRRGDVIRCENCGEDYSITYKRCPFCDERPGRGGVSGKRVSNTRGGGYGRPASTLKTVIWIASFVVVCAAMFIIYRFIGAPIFGGGKDPGSASSSSSQSGVSSSQGGASSQPGGDVSTPTIPDASGGTVPDPVDPSGPTPSTEVQGTIVNAGTGLNVRSGPGTENSRVGSLKNASKVTVLGEENGWYQIRFNGSSTGYVRKDFVSTADAPVAVQPTTPTPGTTPGTGTTPSGTGSGGTIASGQQGTIVNAGSGLNIRSGPGTDHSVVASASNGAEVTVLGEENGWYQIRYNGSSTGYVRKDFVSAN